MIPNDILRRLRFALDLSDAQMTELFTLGGAEVTEEQVTSYLLPETNPNGVLCDDVDFCRFLDGLILDRRGPPDPARPTPAPRALHNNDILRKLRIALDLKQEGMLEVLRAGGVHVSPSELSALFRKETHKHYRVCGDQFLRSWLQGLIKLNRPDVAG